MYMINGIVAIVGRPNVGKSTIFNRMIGERKSIVEDTPGVTRDRIYGKAEWLTKEFRIIDTGGIQLADQPFQEEIKIQVEIAIDEADAIVFVTPLYYFGFTSQIKKVIDRFYAMNSELRAEAKMAYLLAAGADSEDWAMEGIRATFDVMCRYLRWENAGSVLALGCGSREEIKESEYLSQAEVLGRSV